MFLNYAMEVYPYQLHIILLVKLLLKQSLVDK